MPKAKKVTKSNGNSSVLRSNFDLLSWKVLVPALLIFASIGGYYVYSTSASSGYLFVNNYSRMSGGYVQKTNGVNYRVLKNSNALSTATFKENNTSIFCWHFKLLTDKAKVELNLLRKGEKNWSYRTPPTEYRGKGNTYNICSSRFRSGTWVHSSLRVTSYGSGSIATDTFYGKD